MSFAEKSAKEIKVLEDELLRNLPEDGKPIPNKKLREKLNWEENQYLAAKRKLVDSGLVVPGRGQGGVVSRLIEDSQPSIEKESASPVNVQGFSTESALYKPISDVLKESNYSGSPN